MRISKAIGLLALSLVLGATACVDNSDTVHHLAGAPGHLANDPDDVAVTPTDEQLQLDDQRDPNDQITPNADRDLIDGQPAGPSQPVIVQARDAAETPLAGVMASFEDANGTITLVPTDSTGTASSIMASGNVTLVDPTVRADGGHDRETWVGVQPGDRLVFHTANRVAD